MRNRNALKITVLLALGLLVVAAAFAAPRVNPAKGKVFYKKNCRVCHDGAEAKELSPMSKTMDQWGRAFAANGPATKCMARVKDKVGTDLTDQDMLDMQAYLVQHAADSDQPATCGN